MKLKHLYSVTHTCMLTVSAAAVSMAHELMLTVTPHVGDVGKAMTFNPTVRRCADERTSKRLLDAVNKEMLNDSRSNDAIEQLVADATPNADCALLPSDHNIPSPLLQSFATPAHDEQFRAGEAQMTTHCADGQRSHR